MLRPLHYVMRLGDRRSIHEFFINTLGMKLLRHEEFSEGCNATCNGPYDGKWSKTMIGYGSEDNHFVLELTYNYGIGSYKPSNDLKFIKIASAEAVEKIKASNFDWAARNTQPESILVKSPDGYPFLVVNEEVISSEQIISEIKLATNNMDKTIHYYQNLLPTHAKMIVINNQEASFQLNISDSNLFTTSFMLSNEPIVKTSAGGRIAFSYTGDISSVEETMKKANQKIQNSLVTLDTPGKASVQVIILLDPNWHEICVVNDDGFRDLSKEDPNSSELLKEAVFNDKSNDWFSKRGGKPTSS